MIWSKDNYKADINCIFGHSIIEYDMKSANTSLAREFKLLPEKEIEKIERMPKEKREITVGLLKRNNKEYAEAEKQAFISARRMFIKQNQLDEQDILAIKRDAFFVLKYVPYEKVSKNINFRMKNEYSSFLKLNVDVFYKRDGLDIKGIDDDIYNLYHSKYIGSFIHKLVSYVEEGDRYTANSYLSSFWDKYKWLELDTEYYREFNARSDYLYNDGMYSKEEYREDKTQLNISNNMKVISSLVQLIL